MIWDNSPVPSGEPLRDYLATPDVSLRLVRLPAYRPDFTPDEAIWAWAREEVTANTCLGTKAQVQEKLAQFFDGLAERTTEGQRRCRTDLQAAVEALSAPASASRSHPTHVDPMCALV